VSRNPPKRNAFILFIAALFWAAMIFVPSSIGIDGLGAGYAISLVSLLLALTVGVASALYFNLALQLDKILQGKGVLAHWSYTPQQWIRYSQKEHEAENAEKRGLFLVVMAFALFFGFLFWVFDAEAGFYVFVAMLGLIGLVGFAWRFSVWLNYRQNTSAVGEVYITKDGVYMNGRLYSWRAPLTHFKSVHLEDNRGVAVLAFRYCVFTGRAGNQIYTTRVPVPEGGEGEAQEVICQVREANQS
jgi:hypothetical protein